MIKIIFISIILFTSCSTSHEIKFVESDIKSKYDKVGNKIHFYHYHDNGLVSESGYFLNGLPDGKWEVFDYNGKKISEINYKDGKRNGEFYTFSTFTNSYLEVNYIGGDVVSVNEIKTIE